MRAEPPSFINIKFFDSLSPSPEPRLFCSRPVHEGRFMRRLEWGRMRRLRLCLASTDSGGPGFPSGPLRVCHCELAGRGQAAARNRRAAKSPEERTRVFKTPRRSVERRCRGRYFPAIRETSRGLYPRCVFRRSVSPHLRGERTKSPTRAAARERERMAV